MRSKRCETCRYFERHPWKTDDQHSAGTCRVRSVGGFPSRYLGDWCGEWACGDDIDDMPEVMQPVRDKFDKVTMEPVSKWSAVENVESVEQVRNKWGIVAQCPECGGNRWCGPADDDGNVACFRCGWVNVPKPGEQRSDP